MVFTKTVFQNLKFKLVQWFNYLLFSDSIYNTHSPFLYNLAEHVLTDDSGKNQVYDPIKTLYAELRRNQSQINVNDLGAGSTVFKLNQNRSVADIVKTTAFPLKYGALIYRLCQWSGAVRVLELGTGMGISTAFFAISDNPDIKIYTIEGSENISSLAQQNLNKLSLDLKVNFENANFDDILPKLLEEMGQLDIVLMDGNHKKDASLKYFQQFLPYLHSESIILMDDIRWSKEMFEAWNQIISHKSVTCSVDLFRMGLIFFRKELLKPQHISFKY